jgi:hypothetical protein
MFHTKPTYLVPKIRLALVFIFAFTLASFFSDTPVRADDAPPSIIVRISSSEHHVFTRNGVVIEDATSETYDDFPLPANVVLHTVDEPIDENRQTHYVDEFCGSTDQFYSRHGVRTHIIATHPDGSQFEVAYFDNEIFNYWRIWGCDQQYSEDYDYRASWEIIQVETDSDGDGILDGSDNCVSVANADQSNTDGDGEGNACDTDDDNDGVADEVDQCPQQYGEASNAGCPALDSDGDGVLDNADNCISTPNADQADADGEGQGDVCDADDDNDTIADALDNCSTTANVDQADWNRDGQGDACQDSDGDAFRDAVDVCVSDPAPDSTDGCPDEIVVSGELFTDPLVFSPVTPVATGGSQTICAASTSDNPVLVDNVQVATIRYIVPVCYNPITRQFADAQQNIRAGRTLIDPASPWRAEADVSQFAAYQLNEGDNQILQVRMPFTMVGEVRGRPVRLSMIYLVEIASTQSEQLCTLAVVSGPVRFRFDDTGAVEVLEQGVISATEQTCAPWETLDTDADTVLDVADNCPQTPNADQADLDQDREGDACEADLVCAGMFTMPYDQFRSIIEGAGAEDDLTAITSLANDICMLVDFRIEPVTYVPETLVADAMINGNNLRIRAREAQFVRINETNETPPIVSTEGLTVDPEVTSRYGVCMDILYAWDLYPPERMPLLDPNSPIARIIALQSICIDPFGQRFHNGTGEEPEQPVIRIETFPLFQRGHNGVQLSNLVYSFTKVGIGGISQSGYFAAMVGGQTFPQAGWRVSQEINAQINGTALPGGTGIFPGSATNTFVANMTVDGVLRQLCELQPESTPQGMRWGYAYRICDQQLYLIQERDALNQQSPPTLQPETPEQRRTERLEQLCRLPENANAPACNPERWGDVIDPDTEELQLQPGENETQPEQPAGGGVLFDPNAFRYVVLPTWLVDFLDWLNTNLTSDTPLFPVAPIEPPPLVEPGAEPGGNPLHLGPGTAPSIPVPDIQSPVLVPGLQDFFGPTP